MSSVDCEYSSKHRTPLCLQRAPFPMSHTPRFAQPLPQAAPSTHTHGTIPCPHCPPRHTHSPLWCRRNQHPFGKSGGNYSERQRRPPSSPQVVFSPIHCNTRDPKPSMFNPPYHRARDMPSGPCPVLPPTQRVACCGPAAPGRDNAQPHPTPEQMTHGAQGGFIVFYFPIWRFHGTILQGRGRSL